MSRYEIGARGVLMRDNKEGWALLTRRPLEGPFEEAGEQA